MRVTSRPRSHRAEEYSLKWEVVSLVRPEEYRWVMVSQHIVYHDIMVRILYRPVRPVSTGWTTSIIQAADTSTRSALR